MSRFLYLDMVTVATATEGVVQPRAFYSPLSARIALCGVYDSQRQQTAVYLVTSEAIARDQQRDGVFIKYRSEAGLLTECWEGLLAYEAVVTFNGYGFVWPFIYHRSAVCRVLPTCTLLEQRYLTRQSAPCYQIDLYDELTFHRTMRAGTGLRRFAEAYSLAVPPEVATIRIAYEAGEYDTAIALVAERLESIAALGQVWQRYFAPNSFRLASDDSDF